MAQPQVSIPSGVMNHEYAITSCPDKIENASCPCNRAHLLHYKKEQLVYFREKVWGLDCGIEALRLEAISWKMQHEIIEENYIRDTEALREECRSIKTGKLILENGIASLKLILKKYTFHAEDCEIITNATSGRIIDSKCTCGYDVKTLECKYIGASSNGKT